jgi:hypothetical protein
MEAARVEHALEYLNQSSMMSIRDNLTSSPTSPLLSAMASLSPTTLTTDEQRLIPHVTARMIPR